MPAMDGLEFLEEYDQLPEKVKNKCIIIVLSNTSNQLEIKRAEENKHVTLFLSKPLTKGILEVLASAFSDIFRSNNGRLAV
jgi:CheY-like chemotaxis protein